MSIKEQVNSQLLGFTVQFRTLTRSIRQLTLTVSFLFTLLRLSIKSKQQLLALIRSLILYSNNLPKQILSLIVLQVRFLRRNVQNMKFTKCSSSQLRFYGELTIYYDALKQHDRHSTCKKHIRKVHSQLLYLVHDFPRATINI